MNSYTHRSEGPVGSDPTCMLAYRDDELTATVQLGAQVLGCLTLKHAERDRLSQLTASHLAAFDGGWEPDPFELWSCATTKLLAEVYQLISEPLIGLLRGLPRIELRLTNSTLAALPIETAHRAGEPALFEVTQIYRSAGDGCRRPQLPPRTFELELRQGNGATELAGLAAENALIEALYRGTNRSGQTERVVHLSGHDPTVPDARFRPQEQAHAVLSGCNSLPRSLPAGVASATASLWPIDDQSNGSTMALFHARLSAGIGPVEALRQTQLMQRALPPVVWASYVHIGQPT